MLLPASDEELEKVRFSSRICARSEKVFNIQNVNSISRARQLNSNWENKLGVFFDQIVMTYLQKGL